MYRGSMTTNSVITVHLEPREREQLEAEAERRGLSTSALVREYVRAGLPVCEADMDERRRRGREALRRLAALRSELRQAGYPSVDGVELARQVREELDERQAP